jgi:hypothetical protein
MTRRAGAWALGVLLVAARPAPAQQFVADPPSVTAGLDLTEYHFGQNFGVRSLSQWAIPLAVVLPIGRFSLDAGSWYASTTLKRIEGFEQTVTGLTDTQVRASYVLGADAVVVTAMVNLPTGSSSLTAAEYAVLASASSSFLAFPVNAYGSGLSFTGGLAAAIPAGRWSLGLAGSFRVSGDYTPFVDQEGGFRYQSGPEVRFRAAADRLIGSSRLSLGLTFSTFSDDEYATGAGKVGVYRPGRRLIGELQYSTLIGRTGVSAYVWDYYRWAGDSAGVSVRNRENLMTGGMAFRVPVSRRLSWESGAEGRLSTPEEGRAMLLELRTGLRMRVGQSLVVIPSARVNLGRLEEPSPGYGHAIRGFGASVFVRRSF